MTQLTYPRIAVRAFVFISLLAFLFLQPPEQQKSTSRVLETEHKYTAGEEQVYVGCPEQWQWLALKRSVMNGDDAGKLGREYGCLMFRKSDISGILPETSADDLVCVRPRGESSCYWMLKKSGPTRPRFHFFLP